MCVRIYIINQDRHFSTEVEKQRKKMEIFVKKEYLDLVLVPFGLIIVLSYHLFLLYRILYFPYHTIIGFMNIDKSIWVDRIMQASYHLSLRQSFQNYRYRFLFNVLSNLLQDKKNDDLVMPTFF